MTQGIEKVWELDGSKGGIKVEVAVSEQYDILTNTSQLTVGLRVKSSQYYQYTYYLKGSVAVDGEELVTMRSVTPTHYVQLAGKNTYYTVKNQSASYTGSPWTAAVPHHTDGTKTVKLAVSLKGYTSGGGGGSGWSVSTQWEVPLTQIPRASLVAATDANIGAVSMVAVTRRSAEYVHSIRWEFGALSGWLGSDGSILQEEERFAATAVPFRLPDSFYGQISDRSGAVCTLTCRTYWDGTPMGDAQQTAFTVTADPTLCGPVVTGTVEDSNPDTVALTGDSGVLVRYASHARCTIQAAAQKGAAIGEKTVNGQAVTEDMLTVEGIDQPGVVFSCTDSRGYAASVTVRPQMVAYTPLTVNAAARRVDPTGGDVLVSVWGKYYGGSFGAQDNTLTLVCQVAEQQVTLAATVQDGTYGVQQVLSGLDYRQNHTLTVTAADKLATCSQTVRVGKGIPVFDWGEGDFAFHVPVTAPSINGLENLALAAYPVGSLYLTLNNKSPAQLFGGKWERIKDCFLLAAGDHYAPGQTGGEAEHILTVEEMPGHTHAVNYRQTDSASGTSGLVVLRRNEESDGVDGTDEDAAMAAGGDMPHNNMPPYLAVHIWQRMPDDSALLGAGILGQMVLGKE